MKDIYSLPIEGLLKVRPGELDEFFAEQERLRGLEYTERKKLKFRPQYWIDVFMNGLLVAGIKVNFQAYINIHGQKKFDTLWETT